MSVFTRSGFIAATALALVGTPVLASAALADCERSVRSSRDLTSETKRAQQVLSDLGYRVHDVDDEDDGSGVNIEARQRGVEVDVDVETVAKNQVQIEVEVEREGKPDDPRACRQAEEILGRLKSA